MDWCQSLPAQGIRIVHFLSVSDPRSLASGQLTDKGIRVWNEAQKQREIAALVLLCIVDVDSAGLEKDRSKEVRSRHHATHIADLDLDQVSAVERLRAAGNFDCVRGWDRGSRQLRCLPKSFGCQHVDLKEAAYERMAGPHVARFLQFEALLHKDLGEAADRVWPGSRIR